MVEHPMQGSKTVVDYRGMDLEFVMGPLRQAILEVGERPLAIDTLEVETEVVILVKGGTKVDPNLWDLIRAI